VKKGDFYMDVYDNFIRSVIDYPIKGINFRDITPLLANGNSFHQVIMDLNKELPPYDRYDKFIAAESRGFIFGAPLASMNNKGLVLARKAGKLPLVGYRETYKLEYGEATIEIPKDAIAPGDRVIIIDDLIATGGSAKAMVDLVRSAGGIPVMALFLIELRSLQGYKKLGIPVVSIVNYGIHISDFLQLQNCKFPMGKFKEKVNETEIKVVYDDGTEQIVEKANIVSIIQKEKDGRLTYIRYRD
jgi:adenine phosphoribosyltransferase